MLSVYVKKEKDQENCTPGMLTYLIDMVPSDYLLISVLKEVYAHLMHRAPSSFQPYTASRERPIIVGK